MHGQEGQDQPHQYDSVFAQQHYFVDEHEGRRHEWRFLFFERRNVISHIYHPNLFALNQVFKIMKNLEDIRLILY